MRTMRFLHESVEAALMRPECHSGSQIFVGKKQLQEKKKCIISSARDLNSCLLLILGSETINDAISSITSNDTSIVRCTGGVRNVTYEVMVVPTSVDNGTYAFTHLSNVKVKAAAAEPIYLGQYGSAVR